MLTTLYGQALTLKILLVGALLLTSAIHVFLLRPRLHRAYRRYTDTMTRFRNNQDAGVQNRQAERRAHLVMVREKRLAQHTRRLLRILSLEPVLGVAVLICVGFMNVFAGTLAPTPVQPQQPEVVRQQPFHATMQTFDHRFTITLEVSPNQLGTNVFTVGIANAHTGKAVTQVAVDVNTEMLDMDMGIGIITLRPDGHGQFSGQGDLVMSGHWQIIVQIRTPDDPSHFHEAYVRLVTP